MSTSSNDSFVVVSTESLDEDGNLMTHFLKSSVTFENVLESYPLELDLLVRVAFDKTYKEALGEKFLLVPVAWQLSIEDAISVGLKYNNIVKFPAKELPQNGEMCQICCYTNDNKQLLGVSAPFKLEHFSKERLIEFLNHQDHATLLNTLEASVARLEVTHPDLPGEVGTSDGERQRLVQQVTTEVIENLTKKWTSEKEALLNEVKELKEYVVKLEKKVENSSDSDSSASEYTLSASGSKDIPMIYGITATLSRLEQIPLLVRLSHTVKLIPRFHWIVVEDDYEGTPNTIVPELLQRSGVQFTYMAALSPDSERGDDGDDREYVVQRNAALKWLRDQKYDDGIVYFMDEFKTYRLEIFDEMRSIQRVGVWPVGLVGGQICEAPFVDKTTGRVIGWTSKWRPDRQFPMDAIGGAINLKYLMAHPEAMFSLDVEPALRLSDFLLKLQVSMDMLEPKADNCTEVYVFGLRFKPVELSLEKSKRY